MKLTTIVLATAFALSGTAALAQAEPGTSGYGSSVAPSVGSYVWPSVGSYVNNVPTWSNTFHSPPGPSGLTLAPMGPGSGLRR
jgi:hypothetical protein